MSLSRVLWENNDGLDKRVGFRLSWKAAACIAIPACVIGAAGVAYYMSKRSPAKATDTSSEAPKTPLELTVSLKNRGNKFFKAGQYSKALQLYDEGLEMCPLDANTERAALYQNRAAAKENLRQYDSAISDCTLALEQSPRYLKALNRRAHLYEKLEDWENCLADIVACCILEEFKNTDNIISMDQVLKKVGQIKSKQEWEALPHSLPSVAFIRNYLSAFAWNPFVVDSPPPPSANGHASSLDESVEEEAPSKPGSIPDQFRSAYAALNEALGLMTTDDYEKSMTLACKASMLFEMALSKMPPRNMADGDESTMNHHTDTNSTADSPLLTNGHDQPSASNDALAQAKAAWQKARLLEATYLALSGRAVEAKQLFQTLTADGSGAEPIVRVNALIKSACLSMSVDQDFAACLYDFQSAQSACPECPDVYLHRGQINLLADQLDEAMHDLKMAVKLKPEFSIAQAQLLYTLYRKAVNDGNSERASSRVEEFRRLAQKYPNCLETHSLLAQILTERGELKASDEEFAKVIELAPNSGLAYAHRGLLHLRWKQDRDMAYKWFSLGAKADPKCELIHELLGQMAVERGNFQTALTHFQDAIRESKTQNDLAHMIALREGVQAQCNVCKKYGLSVEDVVNSLKREQQQMMSGGIA